MSLYMDFLFQKAAEIYDTYNWFVVTVLEQRSSRGFLSKHGQICAYVKIISEIREEKEEEKEEEKQGRVHTKYYFRITQRNIEYEFSVIKEWIYCLCPSEDEIQQLKSNWTVTKDMVYLKQADFFPLVKGVRIFLKF